jgi:hypothetical protein
LAGLLPQFIAAEVQNPDEPTKIMLAVYEHFEQRTAMHRCREQHADRLVIDTGEGLTDRGRRCSEEPYAD